MVFIFFLSNAKLDFTAITIELANFVGTFLEIIFFQTWIGKTELFIFSENRMINASFESFLEWRTCFISFFS